ncbi:hypothetical protein B0H16DRAFT_1883540 [Mycena metata]|uniref:Transmembrane protein n=1 Tax=Mycena metata TaxID=1033252 RepID=A0AAD7NKG3_9AGAR|nr:hypothetical protein B0H16DRAFT_1883540 [Mycena metata]
MLSIRRVLRGIVSYRLGYGTQRPYPWRWTTPIVLCGFIALTAVLAIVNIPLSAYTVVQENTLHPNDTLPPLPFSNLIPDILESPTGNFAPQILNVGDMVRLNNSIFSFTITDAFDTQRISSFSYYNNPFSDNCDVTQMSINISTAPSLWHSNSELEVTVTCRWPNVFTLTWQSSSFDMWDSTPARSDLSTLVEDLEHGLGGYNLTVDFGPPSGQALIVAYVAVQPCCDCDAAPADDMSAFISLSAEPPCRLLPARFLTVERIFSMQNGETLVGSPNTTDIFADAGVQSAISTDLPAGVNGIFQNVFQSLYHLVRMEMGVILENQIYAFPDMYNRSILGADLPVFWSDGLSGANQSRSSTSNATLMSEWKESVLAFNDTTRVPVMFYSRPVPRLKPLGSAITSVFVSTFAMLSTLWAIFNVIAGAFARSRADAHLIRNSSEQELPMWRDAEKAGPGDTYDSDSSTYLFTPHEEPQTTLLERLNLADENNRMVMAELARMRLALKARGILDDDE